MSIDLDAVGEKVRLTVTHEDLTAEGLNRYNPQMVTYRKSGFAWDQINAALPAFEKMPRS